MGRTSPCAARLPEILAMRARDLDIQAIADALGLTYGTVQAYCVRRGIHFRRDRPRKVDEARLAALVAEGQTQAQIAATLGVSHTAIERRVAKRGLATGRTGPRSGAGHRDWRGGRRLDKHGYVLIYAPMHHQANAGTGTVAEHRLLMEVVLGRPLASEEVVHHRDNHPDHNWPENLVVFASNAAHLRAELTGRRKATPRSSIPGAYRSHPRTGPCPGADETLARCSSETRHRLAWYIESFRPTTALRMLPRRVLRRSGAWRDPFRPASTD